MGNIRFVGQTGQISAVFIGSTQICEAGSGDAAQRRLGPGLDRQGGAGVLRAGWGGGVGATPRAPDGPAPAPPSAQSGGDLGLRDSAGRGDRLRVCSPRAPFPAPQSPLPSPPCAHPPEALHPGAQRLCRNLAGAPPGHTKARPHPSRPSPQGDAPAQGCRTAFLTSSCGAGAVFPAAPAQPKLGPPGWRRPGSSP